MTMFTFLKKKIYNFARSLLFRYFPESEQIIGCETNMFLKNNINQSDISNNTKVCPPSTLYHSHVDSYSYVATNSYIAYTKIGKFCSIGPNFTCGRGMHPIDGISTSPMFYSLGKQNGMTLSSCNKMEECPPVTIGNDVFIGANVTVINGVTIGDGAVIGAGAVVSKDIPPYAIAVGCPINIVKYRFSDDVIQKLLKIQWWDFSFDELKNVERMEFDIEGFVNKYKDRWM